MHLTSILGSALLAMSAAAIGCNGVSWPSERIVNSLRVLGVRAEPASVTPGQSTHLSMLCGDGINVDTSKGPSCETMELAWFADCDNPPNNDPSKCFDHYAGWADQFSPTLADTPPTAKFAVGQGFDFVAPSDILQSEVTVAGQSVHYGVSYVYFAACAGRLHAVPGVAKRLPVECRNQDTGALLDQRRFVVGRTTIYSYDIVANRNPVLQNPSFDFTEIPTPPCNGGGDCDNFDCTTDPTQCLPVVPHCAGDPDSCAGHCLSFQVPASSYALNGANGSSIWNPLKSLWAQMYANTGVLPDGAWFALPPPLSPTDSTWSACVSWQAPTFATDQARLWIVVRDDRGGLSWIDQRVIVR